ncbi:helicase HerA-like domain-containing protein [Sphingomonas sp. HF-S4]|uniref:Helicase HerA-like domain-containing protein n=1 Tax=Sphingomonas agrestis TaxID=3080540 RepID=A0ABU3Y8K1_9SPHN|nr:helicase HerA-like domain-containing protein [Sphingomonas sp. HF-S4]MDV3457735.1 helicase HerA-like domain-containing protein [Sphingomonas sp. HF-S4]
MAGETGIFLGSAEGARQELVLRRANRHGLIAGATGTGKTVTLQALTEGFSAAGVPVFVSDVKGDLSGLGMAGSPVAKTHEIFARRAQEIGDADWRYGETPVQLWDLFGAAGHPIRATVSEMGPLLLARLLDLNDTQEGVLNIAFHVADEDGLLLLDLDDLQAMLAHCAERASELSTKFGNITKASVGTIQRQLLQLRTQGGNSFFGEPALDIGEFIRTDERGRGVVNILAADKLMASPRLYASFLLWMLSELFEILPEIGDPDKPVLVFFFDEAHLLFDDAPKALLDKIEQVVRLIRSKGVGVYFVTQNPMDIPEDVAGQLGNRVQHALRAFTPKDAKAVRSAAETFRPNPKVDVAQAITELKVGEALVSVLQDDGSPSPVERTLIRAPGTRVGPLTPDERATLIATDAVGDKYDTPIDRESAEEILAAKADEAAFAAAEAQAENDSARSEAAREKQQARVAKEAERTRLATERAQATSPWGKMATSAGRAAASSLGRQVANEVGREMFGGRGRRSQSLGAQLVRGVLGGLFRG